MEIENSSAKANIFRSSAKANMCVDSRRLSHQERQNREVEHPIPKSGVGRSSWMVESQIEPVEHGACNKRDNKNVNLRS